MTCSTAGLTTWLKGPPKVTTALRAAGEAASGSALGGAAPTWHPRMSDGHAGASSH